MKSSVRDTIRKLLAQSSDSAVTPQEAEAFRAKAFDLMAREGLSESDVHDQPADQWAVELNMPYSPVFNRGLTMIARALHCECIYDKSARRAMVFGLPRHLERLRFLWPLLCHAVTTQSVRHHGYDAAHTRVKRSTFVTSFFGSVAERLAAIEAQVVSERNAASAAGQGTGATIDLVADTAKAKTAMQDWLDDNGLATRQARSRTRVDPEAYRAGQQAGRVVDLDQRRFGTGRRELSA